ncbi:hypothetical protein D3C87_1432560 [compost metagenome]
MILKIISVALLALNLNLQKTNQPMIQIFDVKQEKVIKQISLTHELEQSIIELLNSDPKIYVGKDMNPKSGLILHLVFENPTKLTSKLYPDLVKEIYLFLEPGTEPKSLIFFKSTSKFIVVVLKEDNNQFIIKNNLS